MGLVLADGVVLGPYSFDIGRVDHQEKEHQVGGDVVEHLLVLRASGQFFERWHCGAAALVLLLHVATIGDQILLEGVFVDGIVEVEGVDEVHVGGLDRIEVGIVGDVVHQSSIVADGVVDSDVFIDEGGISYLLGAHQAVGIETVHTVLEVVERREIAGIDRCVVVDEFGFGLSVASEGGQDVAGIAVGQSDVTEIDNRCLSLFEEE